MTCEHTSCLCTLLKELLDEQDRLAHQTFKFICKTDKIDTIPFLLYSKENSDPFEAHIYAHGTIFFRLENIQKDSCCATLRLLMGIDMDEYPTNEMEEVYSLIKTDHCITVDLNCFLGIQPCPPKLVDRPLPWVEIK